MRTNCVFLDVIFIKWRFSHCRLSISVLLSLAHQSFVLDTHMYAKQLGHNQSVFQIWEGIRYFGVDDWQIVHYVWYAGGICVRLVCWMCQRMV